MKWSGAKHAATRPQTTPKKNSTLPLVSHSAPTGLPPLPPVSHQSPTRFYRRLDFALELNQQRAGVGEVLEKVENQAVLAQLGGGKACRRGWWRGTRVENKKRGFLMQMVVFLIQIVVFFVVKTVVFFNTNSGFFVVKMVVFLIKNGRFLECFF